MAALSTELISESLNWSETHIKRCAKFWSAFYVIKEQYKAGGILQEKPETIYHKQKRQTRVKKNRNNHLLLRRYVDFNVLFTLTGLLNT